MDVRDESRTILSLSEFLALNRCHQRESTPHQPKKSRRMASHENDRFVGGVARLRGPLLDLTCQFLDLGLEL